MKILVADDDPVSRGVLVKILSSQPETKVSEASDGASAWALLDDPGRSFDIAFLDLDMPKVDGFELLKRIQEAPLLKTMQVVICTGSSDRATVIKAAGVGARHYLVKPCTAETVLTKLRQMRPASPSGSSRTLAGY